MKINASDIATIPFEEIEQIPREKFESMFERSTFALGMAPLVTLDIALGRPKVAKGWKIAGWCYWENMLDGPVQVNLRRVAIMLFHPVHDYVWQHYPDSVVHYKFSRKEVL